MAMFERKIGHSNMVFCQFHLVVSLACCPNHVTLSLSVYATTKLSFLCDMTVVYHFLPTLADCQSFAQSLAGCIDDDTVQPEDVVLRAGSRCKQKRWCCCCWHHVCVKEVVLVGNFLYCFCDISSPRVAIEYECQP